ncbi:MAG: C25 family cysteine peptidase [Candidatus Thorarchaeota archaeon]
MKKINMNHSAITQKLTAILVAAIISISSSAIISNIHEVNMEEDSDIFPDTQSYQPRLHDTDSVVSQNGEWVPIDSAPDGTPAEAHATISDTTGITIVADFHGFWRNNFTISGTEYDVLDMPGASSVNEAGVPMLPCLYEFVEIPRCVDITLDVLSYSLAWSKSGYNVTPAPPYIIPSATYESDNLTAPYTPMPEFFSSVYSTNTYFPGYFVNEEGGLSTDTFVIRGHRIIGLGFYPVQFNPDHGNVTAYSQIIVKLKYSAPTKIVPIPAPLRSEAFERILENTLLNYDSYRIPSIPKLENITPAASQAADSQEGADYLIITTREFWKEANKLANWKERKGVPTYIYLLDDALSLEGRRNEITRFIEEDVYNIWNPTPTYVVLFGDVDTIPSTYIFRHKGLHDFFPDLVPYFQYSYSDVNPKGEIASDLGYFTVDGHRWLPDLIYGRISVNTKLEADAVVQKIIQYEQSPPSDSSFFNDILSAGYFEDRNPRNGKEDVAVPFIYTLERIRHHLVEKYGYKVHINYSAAYSYEKPENYEWPSYFRERIDPTNPNSDKVAWSLPSGSQWLEGFDSPPKYINWMRGNITENFNEGRFLAIYYGHGGSKNMMYTLEWNGDHIYNRDDRDLVEGWHSPYYDSSFLADITVEGETPLVLSMACSSGWYDGETDQDFLTVDSAILGQPNPYEEVQAESFAEMLTRLSNKGAIAVIAPSRPAYAVVSGYLLDGIIKALFPGHLAAETEIWNQPIYEMGAALLMGKLNAKQEWTRPLICTNECPGVVRTTFEEYNLFGDPETSLWTEAPTTISVSYPDTIGTSDSQRFVVSVNDGPNPIHDARVCIQQEDNIYEVQYTDINGQAVFEVDPIANPSHLNVTVTKHNIKPHVGSINVVNSPASISVSPKSQREGQDILIEFSGFPLTYKVIMKDGIIVEDTYPYTEPTYRMNVGYGLTRFINIQVVSMDEPGVAVNYVQRVNDNEGPDPWLYSQNDESTWNGYGLIWDNPDIKLFRDLDQDQDFDRSDRVYTLTQGEVHQIRVKVYNRGIISENPTEVTLKYAPFVGSLSWTPIGTVEVHPDVTGDKVAFFSLEPPIPHHACLRATLSINGEHEDNLINNIGYEYVEVIEMSSPGEVSIELGNPIMSTDYVCIKVRQQGTCEDVWNASIRYYSSQAMDYGDSESMTFFVDPPNDLKQGEWRLFTVEAFVNNVLIGGMVFNATSHEPLPPPFDPKIIAIGFIIGSGIIAVIVIAKAFRRK